MKKKVVVRSIMGAPIGVMISVIAAVFISYAIGDGNFHFVSSELIEDCGNEVNAAFCQLLTVMIYGGAFGGLSVIWERDDWSIFKQAISYYVLSVLITLAAIFLLHWVNSDFWSLLIYFIIFTVIYLFVFVCKYLFMKATVKKFNFKVNENIE